MSWPRTTSHQHCVWWHWHRPDSRGIEDREQESFPEIRKHPGSPRYNTDKSTKTFNFHTLLVASFHTCLATRLLRIWESGGGHTYRRAAAYTYRWRSRMTLLDISFRLSKPRLNFIDCWILSETFYESSVYCLHNMYVRTWVTINVAQAAYNNQ